MVKIKDPELINIYDYTLIKSSINQARQQKTLEKQSKKTNIKNYFIVHMYIFHMLLGGRIKAVQKQSR